jgi:hypothetical protein
MSRPDARMIKLYIGTLIGARAAGKWELDELLIE